MATLRESRGKLALFFCWEGQRYWEGTGIPDTPDNRVRLEPVRKALGQEINYGMFTPERYLRYFPNGNRVNEMKARLGIGVSGPTLALYANEWLERKQPPLVRPSLAKAYRIHLKQVLALPGVATLALPDVTPRVLEQMRAELLKTRSLKSVKNALAGSLRACLRDARTVDGLISSDPFTALKWPRVERQQPDPLTHVERDRVLSWFAKRRPAYLPVICTLAWTGMRPSELAGLRWGDIDITGRTIRVSRSRVGQSVSATKTCGSARTVPMHLHVVEALKSIQPLAPDPEAWVFVGPGGNPLSQARLMERQWRPALRVLGIRPRKLYALRHTFISAALTAGCNSKWVAEVTGTSLAMIEQHYGRYGRQHADELALMGGNQTTPPALASNE